MEMIELNLVQIKFLIDIVYQYATLKCFDVQDVLFGKADKGLYSTSPTRVFSWINSTSGAVNFSRTFHMTINNANSREM